MSHTNSNLPYGTQCGRNCNPFGNVATVTMQTSFTVSVISFIIQIQALVQLGLMIIFFGFISDGKVNIPEAGYKFISWERRDHTFKHKVSSMLAQQFDPQRLVRNGIQN